MGGNGRGSEGCRNRPEAGLLATMLLRVAPESVGIDVRPGSSSDAGEWGDERRSPSSIRRKETASTTMHVTPRVWVSWTRSTGGADSVPLTVFLN